MNGRKLNSTKYHELERLINFDKIQMCELAALIGISVSGFSAKIHGRNDFRLGEAKKLAQRFGMPIDELFAVKD